MHIRRFKAVISVAALACFAIATFAPALHSLFEHHEHFVCNAVDVDHLHDDHEECEMCDYLISIKSAFEETDELVVEAIVGNSVEIARKTALVSNKNLRPPLRAPPVA